MLGANPLVSNGSLMTAPDMRGRLRGDPRARRQGRRDRPAPHAHRRGGRRAPLHPPGHRRAAAVRRCVHALRGGARRRRRARRARERARRGRARSRATSRPRRWRTRCGIEAGEIRRMARELAAAERAAVYGRIGTCTQEFGTLASWLVDVLNVLTGNLDRAGGAMFTRAAAGAAEHVRRAGTRQGRALRPLDEPRARAARGVRRAAGRRASPRRSRRRARARSARSSRSPATRSSRRRTRAPRRARSRGSTSWSRSTST